ncbi:hypothetical protein SAMN05444274_1222 [Mariniphaga anaerophila]|uniref:Uncharacterized protein n=1 Tax=Mariniphaga anaerophila TaxID=1484053 RepID=A0A1M5GHF5_9BACT|nr:hypothetical protein [Mariniphaga anaerophila]SHG02942.1 hypothetical protein SAMN05444274_1222 [Mariniphaga anaerophila]
MKLERALFKISVKETIFLAIFLLIVLNGVIFIFSVVIGKPSISISGSGWISQIALPIVLAMTQTLINRNGVLKCEEFNDAATLTKKINSLILKKGYISSDSELDKIKYVRKTKLARQLNFIFREEINVRIIDNSISIFGKRNVLESLRMNLKYDRTI